MIRAALDKVIDAFQVNSEMTNGDIQALTGLTGVQVGCALRDGIHHGVIKAVVYLPPRHYLYALTGQPYRMACSQCQASTQVRLLVSGVCPECVIDNQYHEPLASDEEQKFNQLLRLPFGLSASCYKRILQGNKSCL